MSAAAEVEKMARALDVPAERLQMVAGLPAADLRTLRAQIGEALFQADRQHFTRVAALTKAVPTAVSAKLTEGVLPPLIAARTAELLEPKKGAELVAKIKPGYIADVAAAMDGSRCPELIRGLPAPVVEAVAVELVQRRDWIVIGGFVAQVSDEALARSIALLDGEQLLRVGYVLDDLSRMDAIGALLSDDQVDDLLAAAGRHGLWVELAELVAHLSGPRLDRLRARLTAAPDDVRAAIVDASAAGELTADVATALQLDVG